MTEQTTATPENEGAQKPGGKLTQYTGGANAAGEVDVQSLLAQASASQQDLAALLEGADFVVSRALVDKDTLIGVPHIITSVTFRKGNMDAAKKQHDYVSCEFTTIPKDDKTLSIDAVYNDGSTGIRRQIVQYLAHKGILPAAYGDQPDELVWSVAMESQTDSGEPVDPAFAVKLIVARGLRKSEYTNEFSDEAVTFYLA